MKDQKKLEQLKTNQKQVRFSFDETVTKSIDEGHDAKVVVKNFMEALKFTIAKGEVEQMVLNAVLQSVSNENEQLLNQNKDFE